MRLYTDNCVPPAPARAADAKNKRENNSLSFVLFVLCQLTRDFDARTFGIKLLKKKAMSVEEDTELRDLVSKTLENNGVLAKIRVRLGFQKAILSWLRTAHSSSISAGL